MKMSDEAVIDRIRAVLSEWAEEDAVPEPTITQLSDGSSMRFIEVPDGSLVGRRGGWWLVAAAAAVVIGFVAITVIRSDTPTGLLDDGPRPSAVTEIPVGGRFGVRGLEVTDEAVWVTSQSDEELYRIDPMTNRVVETFSIPSHIEGVRAVGDSLWLSRYEPNEVIRVDPTTGALTDRIGFESQPNLASDGTRLWVIAERGAASVVVEIDPNTGTQLQEIPLGAPPGFSTVDNDSLWVANFGATTVTRVDLTTARVMSVIDVGNEPRDVVASAGAIWVAVNQTGSERVGSVVRIDPSSGEVDATIPTGRWIHSLAAGDDVLWATNFDDGTASVIDVRSATLVATTPIGNRPGGVAFGHGSVWITPHRRNVLLRIDPLLPLEAAAAPDLERTVEVGSGTVYVRCSGTGGPTVLLLGDQAAGVALAVVEARLSRSTRVCAYEPVGIADRGQAGESGPAATVARDLAQALDVVGERGPYVVVAQWIEGFEAQLFALSNSQSVLGLVLVNGVSADYIDRLRRLVSEEASAEIDQAMTAGGPIQWLDESSRQVAASGDLGDLPLVVLSDSSIDSAVAAVSSTPTLTVTESEAIDQLLQDTRRELAASSTAGRLIVVDEGSVTPTALVDAVVLLIV